jgi:PAS domain S-box-containing protein
VTEREGSPNASERKYRDTVRSGSFVCDAHGTILHMGIEAFKLLDLSSRYESPDHVEGMSLVSLFGILRNLPEIIGQVAREQVQVTLQDSFRTLNNEEFSVIVTARPVQEGVKIRLSDITEFDIAAMVVQSLSYPVVRFLPDDTIAFVNNAFIEYAEELPDRSVALAHSPDLQLHHFGKSILTYVAEEHHQTLAQLKAEAKEKRLSGDKPFRIGVSAPLDFVSTTGQCIPFSASLTYAVWYDSYQLALIDQTELFQSRQALQEARSDAVRQQQDAEELRAQAETLQQIPTPILVVNRDLITVFANRAACIWAGKDIKDIEGMPIFEVMEKIEGVTKSAILDEIYAQHHREALEAALSSGSTVAQPPCGMWKNGKYISIEITCAPLIGRDGSIIGALESIVDVSEFDRVIAILHGLEYPVVRVRPDNTMEFVNNVFLEFAEVKEFSQGTWGGYAHDLRKIYEGTSVLPYIDPSERERFEEMKRKAKAKRLAGKESYRIGLNEEFSFVSYRGTRTPVRVFMTYARNYDTYQVSFVDLSDIKAVEQDLITSREEYRRFFHNAQTGLFRMDCSADRIILCNQRLANIFRYPTTDEMTAEFSFAAAFVHPEDHARFLEAVYSEKGATNFDAQLLRRDGSLLWIRSTAKVFPEQQFIEGVIGDSTSQIQAEEQERTWRLRGERQRSAMFDLVTNEAIIAGDLDAAFPLMLRTAADVLDVVRVGIWLFSPDKTTLDAVSLFNRGTGEYSLGKSLVVEKYPAYFSALESDRAIDACNVLTDPRTSELTHEYHTPLSVVSLLDSPIRVAGKVVGVLCHEAVGVERKWAADEVAYVGELADVVAQALMNAQRRESEDALRQSEEYLRTTLNSIGDGVISTDVNGRLTGMNPVAEMLSGLKDSEARGISLNQVFSLFETDSGLPIADPMKLCNSQGTESSSTFQADLRDRQGRTRRVSIKCTAMAGSDAGKRTPESVSGFVLTIRDVTEQYRMQEQLVQSQKMESIGRLAGGVAHDFNNLLVGIMGNAEILRGRMPEDSPLAFHIRTIIDTAERAGDLTKKLLAYSRKNVRAATVLDVDSLIGNVIKLLKHTIDRNITIRQIRAPEKIQIAADESQLHSALLNLAVNARDAMPNGGSMTFATRVAVLDKAFCNLHNEKAPPGEYVAITVSDTGMGMDKETMSHLFEPFFTTKGMGKGTGLGLSIVYGAVIDHNGIITAESREGKGTDFTMYFSRHGAKEVPAETPSPLPPARRNGVILVVEDEPIVRMVARELLESLGHRVVLAEDGIQGVAAFRQRHEEVDLVILDMMMREMNGLDAFTEMKKIDPSVRAVLCSGFSLNMQEEELLKLGFLGFIDKPYTFSTLTETLAKVLGPALPGE